MLNLLILDVDGVLTDGTKTYGLHGEVLSKRFADHDFTAIKKFKADGWEVHWLSADEAVNRSVARDRDISFHYSRDPDGTIDKVKWLTKLIDGRRLGRLIYVGDDLFDLPVMRAVLSLNGQVFCPSNAVPQVQKVATVLTKEGGAGAIMDLYWTYVSQSDVPPSH